MAATSPAIDENRVPVARRNRAHALVASRSQAGLIAAKLIRCGDAVRFDAETPGVPDVTSVDDVRVAGRGQSPPSGRRRNATRPARGWRARLRSSSSSATHSLERAGQQRHRVRPAHDLGEDRDRQRGDRGAALVVAALQHVTPFPSGDVAEAGRTRNRDRPVALAVQSLAPRPRSRPGRVCSPGPRPMVRVAEPACLDEPITAARPGTPPAPAAGSPGRG